MAWYYDENFEPIIGKKIKSVTWSQEEIIFHLENENIKYNAVGDCCSASFIEDLDNQDALKDSKLLSVEVVNGETKTIDDELCVVHKFKFYKIKTEKGMCTISFRNESNGYYDGGLELI